MSSDLMMTNTQANDWLAGIHAARRGEIYDVHMSEFWREGWANWTRYARNKSYLKRTEAERMRARRVTRRAA